MNSTRDKVIEALIQKENLEGGSYDFDGSILTIGNREYWLLNEENRDKEVKNYICDTVEYFVPRFISNMTGIDEEAFEGISENKRANKLVRAIIDGTCGIDKFVENAVEEDGYGHFLSSYNGVEIEIPIGRKTFYAYRVN